MRFRSSEVIYDRFLCEPLDASRDSRIPLYSSRGIQRNSGIIFDHVREYACILRRCMMKRDKYQLLTIERKLGIIDEVCRQWTGPPGNKKDTVQPVSFAGENIRSA